MIMKSNKLILTLSAVAVAAFVAGCGKTDSSKPEEKTVEGSSVTPGATLSQTANQAVDSAKAVVTNVVEQAKTVATNAAAQVKEATATATAEAQKAVDSAKATATNAVATATKQVETAATSATAQAQSLIDKAKSLVSEKKYQDALASLQQLTNFQLTADQQKMVDDLKATITTAMNSEAGKAIQGLFK